MAFKKRRVWTSQPQEVVGVDPAHPLAPYVIGVWVGSRAEHLGWVGNGELLSPSGITRVVAPVGLGINPGSYAGSGIISLPARIAAAMNGSQVSVVAGVKSGAIASGTYPHIFAIRDASSLVVSLALGLDGGSYFGGRVSVNIGGDLLGTSGSAKQGEYAVYGAEWGDGRALYVNGELNVSDASTTKVGATSILPSLANRQSGGRSLNGDLFWCYIFSTRIGAEWQAKLAADPWQLFAPRSKLIGGAAGGGGTTISGALGTAVASGYTAGVNANRTIAASPGTATASGFQATVANSTDTTITGALGTAVASGFQATVANSTDTTVNGALGTAVASGYTATVDANRTIAGALGTADASGFQASVSNTNDTVITGSLGTVSAIGYQASLDVNRTISAALGVVQALGFGATIDDGIDTPTKVGGDDVPRIEIYERRKRPKKKDEELHNVVQAAFDKAMGREKPVQVIQPFDEDEDDIEALMLVL